MFTTITQINSAFTLIEKIKNLFSPLFTKVSDWKYRNDAFYMDNCKKHTTIYKDGHGISTYEFDLRVLKPEQCTEINVRINCMDGKRSLDIPAVNDMLNKPFSIRFTDFGLWYSADNDIIQNITDETTSKKMYNKCLNCRLDINESRLQKYKTYHCVYAVSIPDMFPIENGNFDKELLYKRYRKDNDYMMCSSKIFVTPTKKFEFILSFENSVVFDKSPVCKWEDQNGTVKKKIHGTNVKDIFYTRFHYKIKNPEKGDKVSVKWLNKSS